MPFAFSTSTFPEKTLRAKLKKTYAVFSIVCIFI